MAITISDSAIHGATVGAVAGAICRPIALLVATQGQMQPDAFAFVALVSAVIGGTIGCVAGLIGHPIGGACVGGVLSVVVLPLTSIGLVVVCCISEFSYIVETLSGGGGGGGGRGGGLRLTEDAYMAVVGIAFVLAGAIPGVAGGLAAKSMLRRQSLEPPQKPV